MAKARLMAKAKARPRERARAKAKARLRERARAKAGCAPRRRGEGLFCRPLTRLCTLSLEFESSVVFASSLTAPANICHRSR
jgi:hypothetical protein